MFSQDKDETETAKQVPDSEVRAGNGAPESIRSEASDQEEDEESERGPVAISKALLCSSLFSASTVDVTS